MIKQNDRKKFGSYIVLFVVLSYIFACSQSLVGTVWFKNAKEYVDADQRMLDNVSKGQKSFAADYDLRSEAEGKILATATPNTEELESLLKASDPLLVKMTLITIRVKKINNEKLLKIILANYSSINDEYIKFYSIQCLKLSSDDQIHTSEDRLLQLFSNEKNESLIISALPLLIRIEPVKVQPLLVKYLSSGSNGLRRALYIMLRSDQNNYTYNLVIEKLNKENADEALRFIKELEAGRYSNGIKSNEVK